MRRNKMRVIGITGGVGAGKSTVLDYVRQRWDTLVVQADVTGHEVMAPGGPCYEPILELFGSEILREDKSIDRGKVAAIVFQDGEKLAALNGIVHPAVKKEILARIECARKEGVSLFFLEVALLFEDHYDAICDDLWYIYADESVRRERLMDSRGYSQEKINGIFANQMSDIFFRTHCDYVVENNGDLAVTYGQIEERIHSYETL